MSVTNKAGFTIIETMLFLAVTGMLVVAILAGTGSSINIQRYRDSVSTFKDLLQQQYSEVTTVRNDVRPTDISCNSSAVINTTGTTLPRGQSDCVVLGRYISIVNTDIKISSVVGNNSGSTAATTDIEDLKTYKLSILDTTTEPSQLEWGAKIAWPVSGSDAQSPTTPRTIGILILRSPLSGLTYTFSSNSNSINPIDLQAMVIAGKSGPAITGTLLGQSERRICVDSDGGFGGGLAVLVGAYASSASAIQVRSNDMGDTSTC
jgi:type II secretory pathway pseudopilin PulG